MMHIFWRWGQVGHAKNPRGGALRLGWAGPGLLAVGACRLDCRTAFKYASKFCYSLFYRNRNNISTHF